MRYLFVGAHPDDIEYSCGGTILRLLDEGHKVYVAVMTYGGNTLTEWERNRKVEQVNASRVAKFTDLIMLCHEDGTISANNVAIRQISDIIESFEIDIVFTHYPNDSHQDHRATAQIVKSATRRKCTLIYFDSYSSIDFHANLYVDISPYIAGKENMIRCFKSQIDKFYDRNIDFTRKSLLTNQLNGCECSAGYAEGFVIDTYYI